MSLSQSNGVCPALLIGANEAMRDAQNNVFEPIGFVQSLLDPTNRTTAIQVDSGNGHSKQVRVANKQRVLASEISDTKSCDSGTEKPRFEDVVEVNMTRQHAIHVKEATVRRLCDAYSQLVQVAGGERNVNSMIASGTASQAMQPLAIMREIYEEIALDMSSFVKVVNQDLLTSLTTKVGVWKGGATSKNFSVLTTATGAPVFAGFNQMRQEIAKTGFSGVPIVVGGGNMDLAVSPLEVGCCNESGIDFGQMKTNRGFKFYRDYDLEGAGAFNTANQFAAFMPGTLQLLTYNEYKGNFGKIGTMERGLIALPSLPGIMADMRFLPNECGEYYDLFVNLNFDLYASPTTLFATGDSLEGVNGVFKAVATAV
jgi:hypothetical protein